MHLARDAISFLFILSLYVRRCSAGSISLRELSSVYVPYDYDVAGRGMYALASGASEQSAYDRQHATVYTVGDNYIHVIDFSDPRTPTIVHHAPLASVGNDVELCGDLVGVAVDGQPGTVELYRLFDRQSGKLPHITSIVVGSRPDMLKFTLDCRRIVVANEGEPYEESGYIVDSEGSVSIIHLDDQGTVLETKNLFFTAFNDRADEYVRRGVRWPYKGELGQQPNNLSQSLEPEYITFNKQDTRAYICLQENNAVAVVDLTADAIMDIYPLGFKTWRDLSLDASDKDSGINFNSYDIYSMYQPDSIRYMEVDGVGYIITANEGDAMDFEAGGNEWKEAQRGKDFVDDDQLSDSVPDAVRSALADKELLGRLQFSTVDGQNPEDPAKFDRLYFYGGRSVTIFRADDFSVVYDSGDEIERKHAEFFPKVFNADYDSDEPDDESPEDTFDGRSDNKGPETESVELGEINGKRLMFVGNERTSTLMVYSFQEDSIMPTFESIHRSGDTKDSFSKLMEKRTAGDLDPEDLRFIKASDTPLGKPMLLVTSTKSGTVSMYEVVDSEDGDSNAGLEVVLEPLSTVYIPYDYESGGKAKYGLHEGAVEQSAYDPTNAMVYNVGNNFLHVIDISDVTQPSIVHYQTMSSAGNDIELCGELIGVVLDGSPGTLELYNLYDGSQLPPIASIQVGSKPDMLKFTPDCLTLLVANEGEATEEEDYVVDHEGSVTIFRLAPDGGVLSSIDLDFSSFNARASYYLEKGVRWPYRGELSKNQTTFSQSMEPEYITFNKDATKAYICLQENNAIAVIDLTNDTVVDIYPLGFKSWKNLLLDASDKDGGINFAAYDIYSMYQPDAIKYMEVNGIGYLVTANEGDGLSYEAGGNSWDEVQRGDKFVDDDQLSSSVSAELREALSKDADLGRLQFSTVDGRSVRDQTKFDRLYFFGGRGFSVFRADDMSLVYDSGDEVERKHAIYYPEVFNGDGNSGDPDNQTPEDKLDVRSDNRGPECEAVETGEINGRQLLFVGQERSSSILVYSFPKNSAIPSFESLYRAGGTSDTFTQLLRDRNLGDLGPEDLRFIPEAQSPNGKPLLLVTSTNSGTLAIYEVKEVQANRPRSGSQKVYSFGLTSTITVSVIFVLFIRLFN